MGDAAELKVRRNAGHSDFLPLITGPTHHPYKSCVLGRPISAAYAIQFGPLLLPLPAC
jgi:hypothetical protein